MTVGYVILQITGCSFFYEVMQRAKGKVEYIRREIPSERGSVGRVGENPWKVVEEDRLKKIWCVK